MSEKCPCCNAPATEKCEECGRLYCKTHVNTRRMHDPIPTSEFVPDSSAIWFIKGIMNGLGVNGTWGYKSLPIVFQKIDNVTLACVAGWADLFPGVEEEILKTKKTLEAAGFKFRDLRNGTNGDPSNPISPDTREPGGKNP